MKSYDKVLLAAVVIVGVTLAAATAHAWFGIPGSDPVDLFWFLRR